jgi:transposase
MQTSVSCLGIDVSKATLDCALRHQGKVKSKVVDNSITGLQQLLDWLQKRGVTQLHACCEATGIYWEAVALCLHEQGHTMSVMNPAQIHSFAQSLLARTKTDKQDAKIIAQFCAERVPPAWTPPPPEERTLLAMVRDLQVLKEFRVAESNRLGTAHASVTARLERHLGFLDAEIKALLAAIRSHINDHEGLKRRRDLLDSIPALGDKTIPWLLSYLGDGQRFGQSKKAVAFAGLNPHHFESGTSVHGRARISKIGQADLRCALYMPAVVAYARLPAFQPFVARLKAAGKPPMVIIVALMRKLLSIAQAVLKSGQPFDAKRHASA